MHRRLDVAQVNGGTILYVGTNGCGVLLYHRSRQYMGNVGTPGLHVAGKRTQECDRHRNRCPFA